MQGKIQKEIDRIYKKLFCSGKKDKLIEQLQYKVENLPYELYDKFQKGIFEVQIPTIKSARETLDKIVDGKCSITRFGDGEFACMRMSRIAFHDPCEELAKKLKEAFTSELDDLLVGLPDCFGALDHYVPYTVNFWRKYMYKKREMTYSLLDMNRVYYSAFFNRYYLNYNKSEKQYKKCCEHVNKLKAIWENRDVILFESREAGLGVGSDLLAGAKSLSRIIFCPLRNAFYQYDEILAAFDDIPKETLIMASLGPTATVLAYDLCKMGYQAIDIGHISEEYECFLRKETPMEEIGAGKKSKLKYYPDPNDPEYKKQIIKVLT